MRRGRQIAVLLWASVLPCAAQTALPRLDRILISGVVAARMNDAASTRWAVEHGWLERNLPVPLSESTVGMVGYALAASYGQLLLSRYLVRSHMRWAATATEMIHMGITYLIPLEGK